MSHLSGRSRGILYRGRLRRRRPVLRTALLILAGLSGMGLLTALLEPGAPPQEPVRAEALPVPAQAAARVAAQPLHPLLAPQFTLGQAPASFSREPAARPAWQAAALPAPVAAEPTPALPLPPLPEPPAVLAPVPLPVPRPAELAAPRAAATAVPRQAEPAKIALPALPRRSRQAAKPAAPEDNRNFFERLFGISREPGVALAYAAPQDDILDRGRGIRLSPLPATPAPALAGRTAVYDIEARTVYLPNGERLEAHSGLGDKMDDVRFAHVRMKGVTPPHVYNLVEREALFHGHRAIRLHPVGGSGAIHGRAGLLAHPYLLGPRGDSNGCVSVKDYDRFLQAYLRGEIRRLVVVARGGSGAAAAQVAALDPSRD